MKPVKIRWVLAHEPVELFIRAAEKFKEVVDEKAPGRVDLEILLFPEYIKKYNNGVKIHKHDLLDHVADGKVEMTQLENYVVSKLNHNMNVFDMPFLFKDHDHAARVFEGPIGESLLKSYQGAVTGLAYTYSGGYKQISINENIDNLSELAEKSLRVSPSPVCVDTFSSLGGKPVQIDIEDLPASVLNGTVEGGEFGWPRLYAQGVADVTKTIIDSNHSLLLTNIIVNSDFLKSLPEDLQAIMKEAAMEAGRHERDISINEVGPLSQRAELEGIKIIRLDDAAKQRFVDATAHMYDKYHDYFEPGLIDNIRKA